MSDLYVKTKTVSRGNMYAYEFTVYHRTKRLRTFDTIPEARKYIDAVEQGMRLAAHRRAGRTSPDEITITIPRTTAEQFALPFGRSAIPATTISRSGRAQALETVRGLVYLQLNRPTRPTNPEECGAAIPFAPAITGEPKLRKPPREGHPHTILADAVNQLAIEVEYIAASTHCNHEGDRVRRIQKIRSTLTALIPE